MTKRESTSTASSGTGHKRIPVTAENAESLTVRIEAAMKCGARGVILDAGDTYRDWPRGREKEILGKIEEAVVFCARQGIHVALGGHDLHQPGGFLDGRLEKEKDSGNVLLTYYRPGRSRAREIFSVDLRITFKCNQKCIFCAANRMREEPDPAAAERRIKPALGRGAARFCIEGGEPTLSPGLLPCLEMAAGGGAREIILMTNGVRAADSRVAADIVAAGANRIFVSLHGHSPEISDSITCAEGTFVRTVKGIHNFKNTGAAVYLIFVITAGNARTLPQYVRFVKKEFGAVPVLLSFATPYLATSLGADVIPRYEDLREPLDEAFSAARELGVPLSGMEEQHRPPECALPGAGRVFRNLFAPLEYGPDIEGFIKTKGCGECVLDARCPGVKEFYALVHGTGEIRPVRQINE